MKKYRGDNRGPYCSACIIRAGLRYIGDCVCYHANAEVFVTFGVVKSDIHDEFVMQIDTDSWSDPPLPLMQTFQIPCTPSTPGRWYHFHPQCTNVTPVSKDLANRVKTIKLPPRQISPVLGTVHTHFSVCDWLSGSVWVCIMCVCVCMCVCVHVWFKRERQSVCVSPSICIFSTESSVLTQ